MQAPEVYHFNMNSPCSSASSIRLLAVLAVKGNTKLSHFDIGQAFVQDPREEEVYITPSTGCGDLTGGLARLRKSLYGFRQASDKFHKLLATTLVHS